MVASSADIHCLFGLFCLENKRDDSWFCYVHAAVEITCGVRVCKSGYPLSGYPDLSVNFMAAKNPDILVANPDIRYPDIRIYPLILWQPTI